MRVFILIVIPLLIFSCKKKEDRACWKVAGEQTTITVPLQDFKTLFLGAHIDYTIVQDTSNFMIVEGAENLVNLITPSYEGEKLSIENKNKCNFLRSYKKKKIHVTLHFKELINLDYEGTENLRSEGIINVNYLTFLIKDGSGPVELTLNANAVYGSINHGYGDFTLHGSANYANFRISSNGFCNTNDFLINDSADIVSNSAVKSKFNIDGAKTRIEIQNLGDVEYIGTPLSLEFLDYGDGNLIDGN